MNAKEIVFLNGKFIPAQQAKISSLCPQMLSTQGLFETMRSKKSGIVYLNQHLARLYSACRKLKIKPSCLKSKLKAIITDIVKLNGFSDSRVRVIFWKKHPQKKSLAAESCVLVSARKYKPFSPEKYKKGFSTCVSSEKQDEYSLICGLKTTNRSFFESSFQEATRRGFDEALFLNTKGFIAEASRSNVFFVKANKLFTPALACGCLPGITRQAVMDIAKLCGIKVIEGRFTLDHLYKADEAFLTNSLIGVMPLTRVENNLIGKGKERKITALCWKEYDLLIKS